MHKREMPQVIAFTSLNDWPKRRETGLQLAQITYRLSILLFDMKTLIIRTDYLAFIRLCTNLSPHKDLGCNRDQFIAVLLMDELFDM